MADRRSPPRPDETDEGGAPARPDPRSDTRGKRQRAPAQVDKGGRGGESSRTAASRTATRSTTKPGIRRTKRRTKGSAGPPRSPDPGAELQGRFRYRLDRRLGGGGFGSVYLAELAETAALTESAERLQTERPESTPPRWVALKLLSQQTDLHARNSLKRELAALLAIDNDKIPQVYDWNLDAEEPFVALEYYSAGSLADARAFIGRFDDPLAWQLLADLLSALAAAHRASILHLDVKPSNVLLDGNGGFVLTDFGVSHASRMSRGLLHQGQLAIGLGTYGYRAPEQDSGTIRSFDLRTDLFGVGATVWSAYTGIDLNKRQDVLRSAADGNIYGLQRLSDVRLHCPPALEEIVMELLFIDPDRRPGGAGEVLTRLRAIATGFGVGSRTVVAARSNMADPNEVRRVVEQLVDPLWASICRGPGFERFFAKFEDGEVLSTAGEQAHHTLLLLSGRVRVERRGQLVDMEEREGSLLCVISTLTGAERGVTLRAEGPCWVCIFNEAELEQLVTTNPAVGLRLIRNMATRLASGPPRRGAQLSAFDE